MNPKRRMTHLNLPAGRALATLGSVQWDLEHAQRCCKKLRDLYESEGFDSFATAIYHSAVISYARCFATGVREGLSPEIFDAAPEHYVDYHREFIELRNKHVAHSVNDMEESRAIVLWEKKRHRYEVVDVAHVHMRSGGLSQRDFMAPRRFVWNPTVRILDRGRAQWACGQAAFEPVHMSTGRF